MKPKRGDSGCHRVWTAVYLDPRSPPSQKNAGHHLEAGAIVIADRRNVCGEGCTENAKPPAMSSFIQVDFPSALVTDPCGLELAYPPNNCAPSRPTAPLPFQTKSRNYTRVTAPIFRYAIAAKVDALVRPWAQPVGINTACLSSDKCGTVQRSENDC